MIKLSPKKRLLLLKQHPHKNIQNFLFLLILIFIFISLFIYQGCILNTQSIDEKQLKPINSKLIENRSLLKGWVIPESINQNIFEEKLETHLIYSQKEAETLLSSMKFYKVQGKLEKISSINYDENIILIAYYLWRPLKGNPLFIGKIETTGNTINVHITLDENNFGKEYPFLLAPIHIVSISKSNIHSKISNMQIIFNGLPNNIITFKK